MTLHILSLEKALQFTPVAPTFTMRIRSHFTSPSLYTDLKSSDKWVAIREYVFDDVDYWSPRAGDVLFDPSKAEQMLRVFSSYRKQVKDVVVHCLDGKNRSPAIGLGMNQVFDLGADPKEIINKFKYGTYWMADVLIDTALKIGLKVKSQERFSQYQILEDEEG